VLAPVKLAAVDDHTANGCAVTTNPLGRAMNDDIGTVFNRAEEVATSTEGVVDLATEVNQ
jgi:hypothetical protein